MINMTSLNDDMSTQIDLDGLVNGVATRLERRLNKPGIFILASPGCSRGRLVTVLLRRGLVDVVYAYGGFGSKVGDDVRGRVNEFGSIDELAGKLGSVNGRVAVVARSTTDAIRLRNKLGNAEVIYLPKYYEDAAKEVLAGGVPRVARVRHEGLGEGISPSMLREDLPSKDVESIRKLSPGKGDLKDVIKDFLKKAPKDAATQAVITGLSLLLKVDAAVSLAGSLVGRFVEIVMSRWRKNRDEVIGGFVGLMSVAREVRNYLCDERLCDERFEAVFDEVAYEWGLSIEEFTNTITNIANITAKQLTEEDIKKIINDKLESIEKELNEVKTKVERLLIGANKVEGLLVGAKVFYIYDVENGLLYGNFIVEGGVPRIITWVGTAKDNLVTDLVDAGEFRKVAEEVFSKLVKDGRVVLIGPRGIGKSTLATYVTWRSLLGGLGNVVLDKPIDAAIHIESLRPGDAVKLNNLVEATGKRFVVIYDPSPIEAYYKPETMQRARYDIKGIRETLKELMEVGNAWVVIILPRELYDEVSKSEELRNILNEIRSYIIDVNLKNEGFLKEIIKKYSGCDDVSDSLVKWIMNFDSYTLVAKYVGIWLRERGCKVEDVDKALRESAGEPKLFFANYMWSTVLRRNEDLAKKVSIPLILHAVFGPIPEGFTYITKAVNEGGVWKLIDRDYLAESKLEDLREDDLEPIAKWLSTWHEDLIEETLKELVGLRGGEPRKHYIDRGFRDLIEALDWGFKKALEEVRGLSHEVKPEKIESNLLIFVGERLKNALKPYTDCWKRTAFIIGHALAGIPTVPRPEDLPKDLLEDAEYLSDALGECGVDDYLLVGNVIPPLIWYLIKNHARALTEAFIDEYNEAVGEVSRVRDIVKYRDRGISSAEEFYGLGLASIIAKAAGLGKVVESGGADAALHIALSAIQHVASPDLIKPILDALEPLRDKAPHRYIELLAHASNMESLDLVTVRYIFKELNEILGNYGDVIRGHAWSLVHAINAYTNLLTMLLVYFSDKVEDAVGRVTYLLNELDKLSPSLGVIAWAYALGPALRYEDVRGLMEEKLDIDVVDKANEILGKLNKMRDEVQELMSDKEFMGYVESKSVKADEKAVKGVILEAMSYLKYGLAKYRLISDEHDEVEELFNEVAGERREIGDYKNYLTARSWVLRVEAIKGSLVGKKLVDGFRQLYEETFSKEHFMPTAMYLSAASHVLGDYLVSLALMGGDEEVKKIKKMLEEHLWVLNADRRVSVLTRLMLNALLSPRVELSGELKGKLSVNSEELIDAFRSDMDIEFLPALRIAFGIAKPEDVGEMCMLINDLIKGERVVCGVYAIERLRWGLVDDFRELLITRFGRLKELGVNADKLLNMFDEFMELVVRLDGKSLAQLIAPGNSIARLALMLHALINDDERLAKAHALIGAVEVTGNKLLTKLVLETYSACYDLKSEGFRRAIAKLFFYHV
jgi:hypothetical protein